jgi:hypothetical protein
VKDLTAKREALGNVEASATLIHAIIREQYGEEVYDWDPLTVAMELRDDFRGEPAAEVLDKWGAIQIIMTSGAFFERLDAFMGICNTLASGQPFFSVFDPVTIEEAAWGVTEVALNRELRPFSYNIKQYLLKLLKADGYSENDFPPALKEVFDRSPSSDDIRETLDEARADVHNRNNVEAFIDDELKDMVSQFNKIPSMRQLDDMILSRGLEEFTSQEENENAG